MGKPRFPPFFLFSEVLVITWWKLGLGGKMFLGPIETFYDFQRFPILQWDKAQNFHSLRWKWNYALGQDPAWWQVASAPLWDAGAQVPVADIQEHLSRPNDEWTRVVFGCPEVALPLKLPAGGASFCIQMSFWNHDLMLGFPHPLAPRFWKNYNLVSDMQIWARSCLSLKYFPRLQKFAVGLNVLKCLFQPKWKTYSLWIYVSESHEKWFMTIIIFCRKHICLKNSQPTLATI